MRSGDAGRRAPAEACVCSFDDLRGAAGRPPTPSPCRRWLRSSSVKTFMTPGWSSFSPISCSRLKRSKRPDRLPSPDAGILIATVRPLRRSVAGKIEAMPLRATRFSMLVVIELIAGVDGVMISVGRSRTLSLAQFVRPSAIHAHAFHVRTRISWTLILSLPSRSLASCNQLARGAFQVGVTL